MRKKWLYLFVFILLINLVSASEINLERDIYYPSETLQASISFNFTLERPLTQSNIQLIKNNQAIKISPFIKNLSNNNYYLYFQIPLNLDEGQYALNANNIFYLDNILKTTSLSKNFTIITLDKSYQYLLNNQNQDGSFGNVIETALASLALNNIGYTNNSDRAATWLSNQQDINGCFPKGNCKVRDTAFALMALNSFSKDTLKANNWLLDSSNNFALGTWSLEVNAGNATGNCVLNEQEINIIRSTSLKLTKADINLDCNSLNQSVNLSLSHSYLGNVYNNIITLSGKTINYKINDNGCFGNSYKSDCDYLTTAYAIWVLSKVGSYDVPDYLNTNISETSTLQHALLYLIDKDENSLNWLLNNKQNEAWGKFSSSISNGQNDLYTTSFVLLALKYEYNLTDTFTWLKNQPDASVLDTSIKLFSTYTNQALIPIISVTPGYIDSNKSLFIIENKNKIPTTIELALPIGVTSDKISFNLTDKDNFNIYLDETKFTSGQLSIKYGANSYNIPIFVEGKYIEDKEENKPSLDTTYLEFIGVASQIKETIIKNQSKQVAIKVRNNQRTPLSDIKIEITGDLKDVIKVNDEIPKINPSEIIPLNLSINNDKDAKVKKYSGSLIFKNQDFSLELPITIDVKGQTLEKSDKETEPVANKTEKKSKLFWIIPFAVILLIGIFIFIKSRKPKNESFEDFLKSVQNK